MAASATAFVVRGRRSGVVRTRGAATKPPRVGTRRAVAAAASASRCMHAIVPTAQARRLGDAACTWSVPTLSTTVRDAKRYKRLQAGGTVAAVGLLQNFRLTWAIAAAMLKARAAARASVQ